ncbi:MAG: NAD(+) synthase [Tissierellia bacterium]|nr:NAD(+) synthase [Tissierellia bacterium]
MKDYIDAIVKWLQIRVQEANAKGLVFGLSGGIDSAVVAGLAKKAFPKDALGIIMPIESNPRDEEDARLVASALDLEIEKVDLTTTFHTFVNASFVSNNTMAIANIKPRLRMTTLYYYGQDRGYLVAGSSNASEFYIGYYTKFGDSGSDILPLVNLLKDEVYAIAKELKIPQSIIDKKPTAGLWEGQTDEDEMGFTYDELNDYIRFGKEGPNVEKIKRLHKNSAHKRHFPYTFKGKEEEGQ